MTQMDRGCEVRQRDPYTGRMVRCANAPAAHGDLALHDYCERCSKNLCPRHMRGRCTQGGRHVPAAHGADTLLRIPLEGAP